MKEYFLLLIGYKKEFRFMSVTKFIQFRAFQKVLGINFRVPWPVHLSSIVTHYKNIQFKREINPLGYSANSYIQATNGIKIGSNVIHAVGLTIITSNHHINNFTKYTENKPVIIGDNCWLGANVTILPSVELGNHIIVAAGSIVTKSFLDDNCIIAGIPAKIIKRIDAYNGKHYFLDSLYVQDNNIIKV
jgi:acetyltransferase-like isoleucine patch superfamily enzyme